MVDANVFAERLVFERKRLGLGQKDVVQATGVTQATLSRYENGDRTPTIDFLAALQLVGYDVMYVLNGKQQTVANSELAPHEVEWVNIYRDSHDKTGLLKLAKAYAMQ